MSRPGAIVVVFIVFGTVVVVATGKASGGSEGGSLEGRCVERIRGIAATTLMTVALAAPIFVESPMAHA
jgi:hypothetical protein